MLPKPARDWIYPLKRQYQCAYCEGWFVTLLALLRHKEQCDQKPR